MYQTKACTLQDKKKAMREELNAVNKGRETLRAKLRDLKGKVGANATIQKIEEKIAALDYRITHHTLDLKEENRVCCLSTAHSNPASATCNPLRNILAGSFISKSGCLQTPEDLDPCAQTSHGYPDSGMNIAFIVAA